MKAKRKTHSGAASAGRDTATEATPGASKRRDPRWGWLLVALLGVFVVYLLYEDLRLDLVGVYGYGYVGSAESTSAAPYVTRHHCWLEVWLPSERQASEPAAERTHRLLQDARAVSLSVSADPSDCRGYQHTWRRFRYLKDNPDDLRFAKDLGMVAKGVLWTCFFALLFGIREAVRWVRRRRRRR